LLWRLILPSLRLPETVDELAVALCEVLILSCALRVTQLVSEAILLLHRHGRASSHGGALCAHV
jgi:hypothetical protein